MMMGERKSVELDCNSISITAQWGEFHKNTEIIKF
jgi:hypothetical protein